MTTRATPHGTRNSALGSCTPSSKHALSRSKGTAGFPQHDLKGVANTAKIDCIALYLTAQSTPYPILEHPASQAPPHPKPPSSSNHAISAPFPSTIMPSSATPNATTPRVVDEYWLGNARTHPRDTKTRSHSPFLGAAWRSPNQLPCRVDRFAPVPNA